MLEELYSPRVETFFTKVEDMTVCFAPSWLKSQGDTEAWPFRVHRIHSTPKTRTIKAG